MAKRGRPTKYLPEYIEEVDVYLSENKDTFKNGRPVVSLPTIEGFALHIGVNKTTLYEWEKEHLSFSNALREILTEQQKRLLNKGLSGDYNATIAKLILSSNHGMREKSDVTSNDEPITAEVTINNITTLSNDELIKLTKGGKS